MCLATDTPKLYPLQVSFVVSLIFRLTEQFEVVCLPPEIEKILTVNSPRSMENFDVSLCQIFE